VFGAPGMLVVTVFCVAMRCRRPVPPPLKVLPVCYRFLAKSWLLRRIAGGVRSIVYNGVHGGAGLDRGWVRMTVGLIAAARFGFGGDGLVPAARG
jgi:hypothetical protein